MINKNILITGASRGLGRELARYFWAKGSNLVLVSKNQDRLSAVLADLPTSDMQKAKLISCDLSDENELPSLIKNLEKYAFDSIVNNAAVQTPIGDFYENDWEEWKKTIQTNFLTPVYICRHLLPNILKHKTNGASIINLSGGGVSAPRPNFSAYAAAKSGLVGFTATLAEELRGKVKVNSIAPGALPTGMLKEVGHAGINKAGEVEVERARAVLNEQKNNFLKVAQLCEFLISEKSKDVTGKIISAVWDKWDDFDKFPAEVLKSDLYTMRRIVETDRVAFLDEFMPRG